MNYKKIKILLSINLIIITIWFILTTFYKSHLLFENKGIFIVMLISVIFNLVNIVLKSKGKNNLIDSQKYSVIPDYSVFISCSIAIILFIGNIIISPIVIDGNSMYPSLEAS